MHMMMIVMDSQTKYPDDWENFISQLGRKCHAMSNVWVAETYLSAGEVQRSIVEKIGSTAAFIVAPLNGVWEAQNCTTARKCYG